MFAMVAGFKRVISRMRRRPSAASFARRAGLKVAARLRGRSLADRLLQNGVGPEADAMRGIRARLGVFSAGAPHVVGFLGGQPGTLSTSAACAFARAAARDGQRVLLIDQEGGGSSMATLLGEPGGRIGDMLDGARAWRDCVTPDRVAGLDTLVGKTRVSKPGVSKKGIGAPGFGDFAGMERVLQEARGHYGLIVLGAPELSADKAAEIVRSADVSVLVLDDTQLPPAGALKNCSDLRAMPGAKMAAILLS